MSLRFFNDIAPSAAEELGKFGFKRVSEGVADVVVCRSAKLHGIPEVEKAQIVARAGVGTGNVPVAELQKKLVPVVYAPGGNADSVAEATLGKIIASAKNLQVSEGAVKTSDAAPAAFEKIKSSYKGLELKGKSILLFGFGNIAARLASMVSCGLGMVVYVYRRPKEGVSIKDGVLARLKLNNGIASAAFAKRLEGGCKKMICAEKYVAGKAGDLIFTTDMAVVEHVDIHSVHIGDQGTPFITGAYVAKMKAGAILINTDRGALIDEAAVLEGLGGKIKYYYTDFAPKSLALRKHEKCYSTPHTAATTGAAMTGAANMVVSSILNFMYDGKVLNSKNFPTFDLDRLGNTRITISALSPPDADAVAAIIAKAGLTILQGDFAKNSVVTYCCWDVKEDVADAAALAASLAAFGKVRVIPVNPTFVAWAAALEASDGGVKPANFYAGPAVLPEMVIDGLASKIKEWDNGLSMVETSHRTPIMVDLFRETMALIRGHLNVPEDYDILFLQGGATQMFSVLPMCVSAPGMKLGYANTGTWGGKALNDAKKMHALGWIGEPVELASGKPDAFRTIPDIPEVDQDLRYLWLADNETIHGLEYWEYPKTGKVPLILDMSSNIFSRHIDWKATNIGAIFAGAQKNSGIAGCAIVIIKKEWVAFSHARKLPCIFDLHLHVGKDSMLNTPPVAAVASINLTMKWIAKIGGVDAMIKRNKMKADLLYNTLDDNLDFFVPRVTKKEQRSNMNVTFNLKNPDWEPELIAAAAAAGLLGLKGHRSLGGCRASIYNACSLKNVKRLCDVLLAFKAKKLAK